MEWTFSQKSAIDFNKEKSVLLAAAAGSGKTAVLVERIINRLKSKENPININQFLVLTFTEAAASEMKQKIRCAIKEELLLNPNDKHLKNQLIYLHSAQISTVHAFCNKLLKGNIHLSSYPFNFSIGTDSECELLLKESLDYVMEKYYARTHKLPSFSDLSVAYGGAKGDRALRESILSLYLFLQSLPYPKEWLNSSVRNYKILYKEKTTKNTSLNQAKNDIEENLFSDIEDCYNSITDTLTYLGEDHPYCSFYHAEKGIVFELLEKLKEKDDKEKYSYLSSFSFSAKVRKTNKFPEEEQKADKLRDVAKKSVSALLEFYSVFDLDKEGLLKNLYLRAKTLKNILLMLDRCYKKQKQDAGIIDFSDLEHGALSLLSDKDKNPTFLAKELRERYAEILVDEYQDTSNIQDEIFSLISKDSKNLFMVGDLKQSIYKFRNAQSALFLDKKNTFSKTSEKGELITLSNNFRSRRELISLCNFIFSSVMSKDLGDVTYNEEEKLVFSAKNFDNSSDDYVPEYYIIMPDEEEKEDSLLLKIKEAKFVAERIKELLSSFYVTEKDGTKRKAEHKDIVILMRNKALNPIFKEQLEQKGIPCFSDTEKGYLSSYEVGVILSLLNIIDNPRQDIPLTCVLLSRLFSFTPDELSEIRLCDKKGLFYDALEKAAELGDEKAKNFLSVLSSLRKKKDETTLFGLLVYIYDKFNALSLFSYLSSPEHRRANLKLLLNKAKAFESTRHSGLFGFMNYIAKLKENQRDISGAKTTLEGENAVRIMTIHKSKGLEFPIVFLADTSHKFNLSDTSKNINYNDRLGLFLSMTDAKDKIKYPSLSSYIFKTVQKKEFLSEEMRLLYVALTRAKEKLIITSAFAHGNKIASCLYGEGKKPLGYFLKNCNRYSEWLSASLLCHKDLKNIREELGISEEIVSTDSSFPLYGKIIYDIKEKGDIAKQKSENKETIPKKEVTEDEKIKIENVLGWEKESLCSVPFKISVSALKKNEEQNMKEITFGKNILYKEKEEFSPQEKGTINHFMLCYLNEKEILSRKDLLKALDEALALGVITPAQKDVVNEDALFNFYQSDLGEKLRKSKKVYKEYNFYLPVLACEIFDDIKEEEKDLTVMLQGTIDCFFETEEGDLILIDYKTDRVKKENLKEHALIYKTQIECYDKALFALFGKSAKERYIYFLNSGNEVML